MAASLEERIRRQEEALALKKARLLRNKAKLRTALKKADTRRAIVLGTALLDLMEQDEALKNQITGLLSGALDKPEDRALFGLAGEPNGAGAPSDAV